MNAAEGYALALAVTAEGDGMDDDAAELERVIRDGLTALAIARELEASGLMPAAPRPAPAPSCPACGGTSAHRMWVPAPYTRQGRRPAPADAARCVAPWHAEHGPCGCGCAAPRTDRKGITL